MCASSTITIAVHLPTVATSGRFDRRLQRSCNPKTSRQFDGEDGLERVQVQRVRVGRRNFIDRSMTIEAFRLAAIPLYTAACRCHQMTDAFVVCSSVDLSIIQQRSTARVSATINDVQTTAVPLLPPAWLKYQLNSQRLKQCHVNIRPVLRLRGHFMLDGGPVLV